jgi:RHS repeat-associated protein
VTSPAGSQAWQLDLLGNWAEWKNDSDYSGSYSAAETDTRRHNGVNDLFDRDWGTAGADETLTYDANGNLRTRVAGGVTTTYTHDAWNRLVKVVVGSSTMLEQQHNGLSWRTWKRADTNNDGSLDEERAFAYSSGWQLLEERVDASYLSSPGLDKRVQHVWGKRYIDDAVLQRCDRDNDGDYVDASEFTWYHLTDAMFSTVAMTTRTGTIHERVTYDAYGATRHHWHGDVNADGAVNTDDRTLVNGLIGQSIGSGTYRAECDLNRDGTITTADRTIASSSKTALAAGLISDSTASGPDNAIGWDGYVFNAETRLYTVRHRTYEPVLGRWLQRDPIGYGDSSNLTELLQSAPSSWLDPTGLQTVTRPAVRPLRERHRPSGPGGGVRVPKPIQTPKGPRYRLDDRPWEWDIPYWQWETPVDRPGFPGVEDSYPAPPLEPAFPQMDPSEKTYPNLYPTPEFEYEPDFVGPPNPDKAACTNACFEWCKRFYRYHDHDGTLELVFSKDEVLKRLNPAHPFGKTPCEHLRDALDYHRDHIGHRRRFFDCMSKCAGGNLLDKWEDKHSGYIHGRLAIYHELLKAYYARGCNWLIPPIPPGARP